MDKKMEIVDTHFHVWDLERFEYPWPTADDSELYRNFSIKDYIEATKNTAVKYAIFVQVLNKHTDEIEWLLELSEEHPIISGIVGGLDLTSPDLSKHLEHYCRYKSFLGARHILDFEDEKWITRDDVNHGLSLLEAHGLTFDLLLRPHLLKYIPAVVSKYPRLKFVVNHIAKPLIKDQKTDGWKEEMTEIAKYPNAYCKISGLVSEGDQKEWKKEDFLPYVKHIIEIFGEDRCMFGSDFPVFYKAAPDYKTILELANWLMASCDVSESGISKIFRDNAVKFYNLKV